MKSITSIVVVASVLALASCGKKEEMPTAPSSSVKTDETICSYAPSQSAAVSGLTGAAGGGAVATGAIAQALGLSVVTHSSGALLLTGSSGYIAGTLGAAAAGPVVIGVGVLVAGSAGVVELLCAPRNHPEMVAQVEAAAEEFSARSKASVGSVASTAGSFIVEKKVELIKSGNEAFEFANRKLDEIRK